MWNTKRPNTFEDAYRILDDALAVESPPNLGSLVDKEIGYFKARVADETRDVGVMVVELKDLGLGHASQIAKTIEADIRENPALYLGVVALGALALGVLLIPSSTQSTHAHARARQVSRRKTTQIRGASK